jgi:16S rRNA (cytosine967-C5)-methyltransferase
MKVPARQLALDLLMRWQDSNAHAETLLADIDREMLTVADRALVNALVLGVLRHAILLDRWIDQLRDRGRLRDRTRWILRLGLLQLLKLGVPPHAAVNETVKLATREKPLVNAILRRAIRERSVLEDIEARSPLDVRFSLPAFLLERWRRRFDGETTTKLAASLSKPAPVFVRLNRLHPNATPPPGAEPVAGAPDFFRVSEVPRSELEHGLVYVQDPSTAMAPTLLAPKPGGVVLDACASPGGKCALLAQLMQNSGRLIATDSSEPRLDRLRGNLTRLGVRCAEVRRADWTIAPGTEWPLFDAILLDVPCSNTGVMRRRVDVRWRVSLAEIRRLAEIQFAIISHTVPFLPPGGRLVYSTCSLEPEENEEQVARILSGWPQLKLVESRLILPSDEGFDGAFAALFA